MKEPGLIAERYAEALSRTVAEDSALESLRDELRSVAEAIRSSRELERVLENPVISEIAKLAVIDEIAAKSGASQLARRFLAVVSGNGRLPLIPEIAEAVASVCDRRAGIQNVELALAAPLDDALRARLESALSSAVGGKIRVDQKIDPSLIGGLVARVGTKVYDGSLKTRLERMRSLMSASGAAGSAR